MDKKRKSILILIIIGLLCLTTVIIVNILKDDAPKPLNQSEEPIIFKNETLVSEHDYNGVVVLDFVGKISNEESDISFKLENKSDEKRESKECIIVLLDSNYNQLETIPAILPSLEPNSEIYLKISVNTDLSKIHDYKIIDRE